MSSPKACYRRKASVISRVVGNEIIVVPTEGSKKDLSKIYAILGSGVRVWNLFDGKLSLDAIVKTITREYSVGVKKCGEDLTRFVKELASNGLVELSAPGRAVARGCAAVTRCVRAKAGKKLEYDEPRLRETHLDTPEATNYLAAIFVGTALAGCNPAKS